MPTLGILVTDYRKGTMPYESKSGGEKTRCALAIIFGLAIIKATRVGMQLGLLFVDEPNGLDAEGMETYVQVLHAIHERFPEMRILAISHNEEIKAGFAQQIFVDETNDGSKVRKT